MRFRSAVRAEITHTELMSTDKGAIKVSARYLELAGVNPDPVAEIEHEFRKSVEVV